MDPQIMGCILAGGYGSRIKNILGDHLSKSMLPIGEGILLVDVAVQKMLETSADPIVVAFGYRGLPLVDYISEAYPDCRIIFFRDEELFGPANVLVQIYRQFSQDNIKNVVVIPSDQVYDFDLQPAIDSHVSKKADITEITVSQDVDHCKKIALGNGESASIIGLRIVGRRFLHWLQKQSQKLTLAMYDVSLAFRRLKTTRGNVFTYRSPLWEDLGEEARYLKFISSQKARKYEDRIVFEKRSVHI